jgi:PIN domain nuclease of toxin-antitoxin system
VRLLLDTSTFLWVVADPANLSPAARDAFSDPGNAVFLSVISAWEITVKHRIGRLPLPEPQDRLIPAMRAAHAIARLPLAEAAALTEWKLPPLHRDPFDRMLVCQAILDGLTIVTPDAAIWQYPVRTLW